MRRYFLPLLFCAASGAFAAAPSRALDQGEINGAKYAIVLPAQWNRQLILVAPSSHTEAEPLVAAFSAEDVAYRTLFSEGWMVAKTSFRRNGLALGDHLADLDALRAYIAQKYGRLERVLVIGDSLGGLVSILVAEREPREPPSYDGVLAISPALHLRDPSGAVGLSLQPKIPILFLVNQAELEGPKHYIVSPFARDTGVVTPSVFRLARGGSANVNQSERLAALRALNQRVERGPEGLPRPAGTDEYFDATIPPEPKPSTVAVHANGHGFDTRVTTRAGSPGSLLIDAQPGDFATAGIPPFTWFRLTVHDKTYRTFYGRDFNSVKRGEWVVVPGAEGNFILARHLGDAAAMAKIAPGDVISIESFDRK